MCWHRSWDKEGVISICISAFILLTKNLFELYHQRWEAGSAETVRHLLHFNMWPLFERRSPHFQIIARNSRECPSSHSRAFEIISETSMFERMYINSMNIIQSSWTRTCCFLLFITRVVVIVIYHATEEKKELCTCIYTIQFFFVH